MAIGENSGMINWDLVMLFVFFLMILGFGMHYNSGMRSLKQFAIAERSFRTSTLAISMMCLLIPGTVIVSLVNNIYEDAFFYPLQIACLCFSFWLISFLLAPKMNEFLGMASMGEVIGSLYSWPIRVLSSLFGVIISIGLVTVQIKLIAFLFSEFTSLSPHKAVIFSVAAVVIYTGMGGVRAMIVTNITQILYSAFFLMGIVYIVWEAKDGVSEILLDIPDGFFEIDKQNIMASYTHFIPFLVPALTPALFQKMLMSSSTEQMKSAFKYTIWGYIALFIMTFIIAIAILADNPGMIGNEVIIYIIENYSFATVTIFSICIMLAMVMSTIDAHIHASAVAMVHDVINPFRKNTSEESNIFWLRMFVILIAASSVAILFYAKNIIPSMMNIYSFYLVIVTTPLILGILGFRTSWFSAVLGMICGATAIVIWCNYPYEDLCITHLLTGMSVNVATMVVSHYFFFQKGGFMGAQPNPYIEVSVK